MFDELSRILRQLDGQKITVTPDIAVDEDGYIDRECPHDDCMFEFKVHDQDWREIVRDEEVFCPFCGHSADAQKWWTTEQIEKIQEQAFAQVKGTINQAMRRDAEAFNRRQRKGSFITMKMKVERGFRDVVLPASAAEPMRLKLTCEECSCRFAVIGSAFFCPSCGHNSADKVFGNRSMRFALLLTPSRQSGTGYLMPMHQRIPFACSPKQAFKTSSWLSSVLQRRITSISQIQSKSDETRSRISLREASYGARPSEEASTIT